MRPIATKDFSALVAEIYDCALDPDHWPGALIGLCGEMRFRLASLILADEPGACAVLDVATGVPEKDRATMLARSRDAVDAWGPAGTLATLPLDTPLVHSLVNPEAGESRYMREVCLPLGFSDSLSILFSRERAAFGSLSFGRHVEDGPIGAREVALAQLFMPHLKRALAINRLLGSHALERATFAAVLDRLSIAVLVVARDARLLHANRAGERMLRAADPLGLRAGNVRAANGVSAPLRAALATALLGGTAVTMPARRGDGEQMVLHVLPLVTGGIVPGAAAAIFVAPATTPRPAPLDAVAALFDLTPAEARVLQLLGAGRANAEIAATLGIAVSTVRTHVLRLYEKTDTHRQAELVALLASFSLPVA